jgi:hypothetical protein
LLTHDPLLHFWQVPHLDPQLGYDPPPQQSASQELEVVQFENFSVHVQPVHVLLVAQSVAHIPLLTWYPVWQVEQTHPEPTASFNVPLPQWSGRVTPVLAAQHVRHFCFSSSVVPYDGGHSAHAPFAEKSAPANTASITSKFDFFIMFPFLPPFIPF